MTGGSHGAVLIGAVLLIASSGATAEPFGRDDIVTDPAPDRFTVCHGYGCARLDLISLDRAEWEELAASFSPPATDGATERAQIAAYIAAMERVVGARTGTDANIGGTFRGVGRRGQMNCIDESINTTLYLRMTAGEGLLRHHRVGRRATRGFFIRGWPHTTAVIEEIDGGGAFAVDSWFEDNGSEPHIVPLRQWRRGWKPER